MFKYTNERAEEHNKRRRKHKNTPDVDISLHLACEAKKYADELASDDTFTHDSDRESSQGENLARGRTTGRPWKIVPEEWWYDDEFSNYDFSTGG